MGKIQLAANGYSNNAESVKDFRTQEYDVIIAITRDLRRLQNDSSSNFNDIVNIVHKNERLWIAIGAQVASEANELPKNLRANLLYISKFVSHHTNNVLKKTGNLDVLVDLNVSVLRGLKGAA